MARRSLLLVDDETALVALLKRYLERRGHLVETCGTAADALRLAREKPGLFDLVMLDLGLPDRPGTEILDEILAIGPHVRVLVVSGTPYDSNNERVTALLKPFTPQMLEEALEKAV